MVKRFDKMSLRKWLRYYWIGMLCLLIIVFLISRAYITHSLTQNKEKELAGIVQVAGSQIDTSMEVIDSFIYETFIDSSDLHTIVNGTRNLDIGIAKNNISKSIDSICGWSNVLDGMVFYAPTSQDQTMIEVGTTANYSMRKWVREFFYENVSESIPSNILNEKGYMTLQVDAASYIIRVIKIRDCYFASCISDQSLLSSLHSLQEGMDSILFIADEGGQIISASEEIEANLDSKREGSYIQLDSGAYLQTGYVSAKSKFYFGVLTNKTSITAQIVDFQVAFFVIFLAFMLFLPVSILLANWYIEKPLSEMVQTMKRVGKGEWDIAVRSSHGIIEFDELTGSFNEMLREIENLKILNYESKIRYQKADLQYLQLQIKPHFYVNALNIIYSLAQVRDYKLIQKMTSALVEYSRYMFQDAVTLVALSKELQHVKNYMEIQQLRYSDCIIYEEQVEERAIKALVPPFLVQSFVENSVKYAFQHQTTMKVQVRASVDEERESLILEVRDNGNGYPDEVLKDLHGASDEKGEYHIGLRNVSERLLLIYGEAASIQLSNENGALTVVNIPLIDTNHMLLE